MGAMLAHVTRDISKGAAMGISATTYTPKWGLQPTKLIRVPEAIADEVLDYAHYLDEQRSAGESAHEPGGAYAAPPHLDVKKPVNVASVPLRSPFRYPGGKTWLVPYIRAWLGSKEYPPAAFVEPFAGGGICSLTAAFEALAGHVLLAELDAHVADVWKTMLHGQEEWLAQRILSYDLTLDNVRHTLDADGKSLPRRERAFHTILRNRVQRGGIMAPGAGLIKSGENGRGVGSRWYPETLARRIREIGHMRHALSFYDGDGFELIEEHKAEPDYVFFADPPYTKAAKRLYVHWQFDHRRLFEALCDCRGDFLISYDNTEEIADLAAEFGLDSRPVAMKNTHHAKMTELLIGRNLNWLPA